MAKLETLHYIGCDIGRERELGWLRALLCNPAVAVRFLVREREPCNRQHYGPLSAKGNVGLHAICLLVMFARWGNDVDGEERYAGLMAKAVGQCSLEQHTALHKHAHSNTHARVEHILTEWLARMSPMYSATRTRRRRRRRRRRARIRRACAHTDGARRTEQYVVSRPWLEKTHTRTHTHRCICWWSSYSCSSTRALSRAAGARARAYTQSATAQAV